MFAFCTHTYSLLTSSQIRVRIYKMRLSFGLSFLSKLKSSNGNNENGVTKKERPQTAPTVTKKESIKRSEFEVLSDFLKKLELL